MLAVLKNKSSPLMLRRVLLVKLLLELEDCSKLNA